MAFDIEGAVVLITGGNTGIGKATAIALAGKVARVVITSRDEARGKLALEEIQSASGRDDVEMIQLDLARLASVRRFAEQVNEGFDRLDVLINNAGTAGPTGPVESLSFEDWRSTLAVNLDSQFLCTRLAVGMLKTAGGGSIVNISSTAGLYGYPLRAPYAAAKWGVIGLTKTLAMELGPHGIRVNAICPGGVDGERMDRVVAAEARARRVAEDLVREGFLRQTSMRTFVGAEDVAALALFLCSDAGAKISGQALAVDGHTEGLGMPETP